MLKGDTFITTKRAIEYLGITDRHLRRLVKKQGWEVVRNRGYSGRGNQKLLRFSDILAYIIERKGIIK